MALARCVSMHRSFTLLFVRSLILFGCIIVAWNICCCMRDFSSSISGWSVGCYANGTTTKICISHSLPLCFPFIHLLYYYRDAIATFINFEWRSKTTTAVATRRLRCRQQQQQQTLTIATATSSTTQTFPNALFGYSYKIFCNKWHVLFSCTRLSFSAFDSTSLIRCCILLLPWHINPHTKRIDAVALLLLCWYSLKLILRWYKCGDFNTQFLKPN